MRGHDSDRVTGDVITGTQQLGKLRGTGKLP